MERKKQALIIGGNGFVGGHLASTALQQGYEVSIMGTSPFPVFSEIPYFQADITKLEEIKSIGEILSPDIIINCAAISNIDFAQKEKEVAYGVNTTGAKNGAITAACLGCRYIWFSSDAVYEGTAPAYSEQSETNPINYYGETKLEGERGIFTEYPNSLIVRVSWILGFPMGGKEASLSLVSQRMLKQQPLYASYLEHRSPIDVKTLCNGVYELNNLNETGIYNLGSTDFASRPYIMEQIGKYYNYKKELFTIIGEGTGAPRHKNGILIVDKALQMLQKTKLIGVDETIKKAIETSLND